MTNLDTSKLRCMDWEWVQKVIASWLEEDDKWRRKGYRDRRATALANHLLNNWARHCEALDYLAGHFAQPR